MNWKPLTLGERMVMIARIAAAEHVRQAIDAADTELRTREGVLRMTSEVALAPGTFSDQHSITPDERDEHRESA